MTAASGIFSAEKRVEQMRVLAGMLERRVAQRPDHHQSWVSLASLLFALGDVTALRDRLSKALAQFPDDRRLSLLRAGTELRFGDLDTALKDLRALWEADVTDRFAGRLLLPALKTARRYDLLNEIADRMPWLAEEPHVLLQILSQRAGNDPDALNRLLACADAVLAQTPGHVLATFSRAVALARLGQDDAACATLAYNRGVVIEMLTPPPGWTDLAAFNADLAAEIRANPTLLADPRLNSTRGGRQTSMLIQPGQRAVPALIAAMGAAFERHAAKCHAGIEPATAPDATEVQCWAVVYGADGVQQPHLHPGGWLSAVYYVESSRDPATGRYRGDLLIGPIDKFSEEKPPPWGIRRVEPVPGRIVMFPSFTPHATAAPGVDDQRIVVAFDLVPRKGAVTGASATDAMSATILDALSSDAAA